jgi:hypothetical protein
MWKEPFIWIGPSLIVVSWPIQWSWKDAIPAYPTPLHTAPSASWTVEKLHLHLNRGPALNHPSDTNPRFPPATVPASSNPEAFSQPHPIYSRARPREPGPHPSLPTSQRHPQIQRRNRHHRLGRRQLPSRTRLRSAHGFCQPSYPTR